MFCPNCGKRNDDAVRFCGTCGTRLNDAVTAPAQVTPTQSAPRQATPQQPVPQPPVFQQKAPQPVPQTAPQQSIIPVIIPVLATAPVQTDTELSNADEAAEAVEQIVTATPSSATPSSATPSSAAPSPVTSSPAQQQFVPPVQPIQAAKPQFAPPVYAQPQYIPPVQYVPPVQQVPPVQAFNQSVQSPPMGAPFRPLRYEIFGANLPAVAIRLDPGESIFTQSGGMTWMDRGITMETNMKGGLMKGLGRMMSGESLFMATYTSNAPNQEIVIASSFPGSIAAVVLKGNSIIAQKSAFLCAQPSVNLSAYVVKGFTSGLFGGEGFILQRLAGYGTALIEIDGSLVERILAPNESIRVDTGNVAAFEDTVNYQVETVKGFKNILFGGEGLFLTTVTGPGKVWLQTMTLPGFAKSIIPFLPKPHSN